MNNHLSEVIAGRTKIYHGDQEIESRVSDMREETELIHEVATYYFGEGDLFFTEERSEIQEGLERMTLPWSYDCPFCDCTKKLFRVFTHLNLFYCYSCERYGDEIGLIKQIELCSTDEAMEKLEEIFDYISPKDDDDV